MLFHTRTRADRFSPLNQYEMGRFELLAPAYRYVAIPYLEKDQHTLIKQSGVSGRDLCFV